MKGVDSARSEVLNCEAQITVTTWLNSRGSGRVNRMNLIEYDIWIGFHFHGGVEDARDKQERDVIVHIMITISSSHALSFIH